MTGIFHNLGGSRHAAHPAHRRYRVYITLILALAIGSVNQTPAAFAAPPGELAYFYMDVVNPKTTLRCGQTVTYLVKVEALNNRLDVLPMPTPVPGSRGLPKGVSVIGVKVEAFSVDKNVGNFVATEKGFATAYTTVVLDDDLAGLGARFKFKAIKPGKTTLHFDGLVGKEYVSFNLEVKVLPCKFKATTIGEWYVPGPANIHMMAISDDAEVSEDEQGSVTGSAAVNWIASADRVLDCVGVLTIGNSQVDWTGEMDDVDRLTLISTYQPAAGLIDNTCANAEGSISGTFQIQLTPDSVQVSTFSSGGVFRQSQVLEGPEGPISGFVTIIIVPEDEEAVAFIPGNHQAH